MSHNCRPGLQAALFKRPRCVGSCPEPSSKLTKTPQQSICGLGMDLDEGGSLQEPGCLGEVLFRLRSLQHPQASGSRRGGGRFLHCTEQRDLRQYAPAECSAEGPFCIEPRAITAIKGAGGAQLRRAGRGRGPRVYRAGALFNRPRCLGSHKNHKNHRMQHATDKGCPTCTNSRACAPSRPIWCAVVPNGAPQPPPATSFMSRLACSLPNHSNRLFVANSGKGGWRSILDPHINASSPRQPRWCERGSPFIYVSTHAAGARRLLLLDAQDARELGRVRASALRCTEQACRG